MEVTKKLAEFIVNTNYEDIPIEAIKEGKRCFLDGLGVILAGSRTKIAQIIVEHIKELGGKPESTVLGFNLKTSCLNAALANGTMAHADDYDDANRTTAGHPTAPVLPAILAIGEREMLSGKEALLAYVLGYDVESRLGYSMNFSVHGEPLYLLRHTTGILGTFGAATAASKMLNLDEEQVINAFGISCSEASGILRNNGTMTKSLHAGQAAENGLRAAILAKKGYTTSDSCIEGEKGFAATTLDECDFSKTIENLGSVFHILEWPPGYKLYPCCMALASTIDRTLSLVKQYDIHPNEVAEVRIGTTPRVASFSKPYPKSGLEGKFSVEYVTALSILERKVVLEHFTDEKTHELWTRELMRKINVNIDPELSKPGWILNKRLATKINVKLKNGKKYYRKINYFKGEPVKEAPSVTDTELVSKFINCAKYALSKKKIDESLNCIWNIEKISIKDLIETLQN